MGNVGDPLSTTDPFAATSSEITSKTYLLILWCFVTMFFCSPRDLARFSVGGAPWGSILLYNKARGFVGGLIFFRRSMATFTNYRFVGYPCFIDLSAQVPGRRQSEFNHVHARFTKDKVIKRCKSDGKFLPVLRDLMSEACNATIRVLGHRGLRKSVSFIANLVANLSVRMSGVVHPRYVGNNDRLVLVINVVGPHHAFCNSTPRSNVMTSTIGRVRNEGRDAALRLQRLI